jgi:hypothetical protein
MLQTIRNTKVFDWLACQVSSSLDTTSLSMSGTSVGAARRGRCRPLESAHDATGLLDRGHLLRTSSRSSFRGPMSTRRRERLDSPGLIGCLVVAAVHSPGEFAAHGVRPGVGQLRLQRAELPHHRSPRLRLNSRGLEPEPSTGPAGVAVGLAGTDEPLAFDPALGPVPAASTIFLKPSARARFCSSRDTTRADVHPVAACVPSRCPRGLKCEEAPTRSCLVRASCTACARGDLNPHPLYED